MKSLCSHRHTYPVPFLSQEILFHTMLVVNNEFSLLCHSAILFLGACFVNVCFFQCSKDTSSTSGKECMVWLLFRRWLISTFWITFLWLAVSSGPYHHLLFFYNYANWYVQVDFWSFKCRICHFMLFYLCCFYIINHALVC